MNLILPTAKTGPVTSLNLDDMWLGEKMPDLDLIPKPDRFNVIVKQVNIQKKVGSIVLPDTVIDNQQWLHGLAIVVKTGPSVYRGRKFEDVGLLPEDGPKPGDVVYFEARAPRRFKIDGELFMLIADDAILARIDRKHAHRVEFQL